MEDIHGYATLAARLASFEAAVPLPAKKRASTAKAARSLAWPHKTPTPAQLAHAGFYYNPSSHSNDNTVCFLCDRALDGWEEDDDPVQEHLKHSGGCAWATLMAVCQESHDPSTMEDPTSGPVANARRATFASGWPHESKRGWVCKTEKMVEAGWYFAPTMESEDFVSCAYCKLSLDGWEPKDNPFDEHHRRSPDCPFFVFAGTTAPKPVRGKKSRTSKATRLSTQSNLPTENERQSIPDLDESIDTSTVSIVSTLSTAANKKSTKGKKKAAKTKETAPPPTRELDSSVVEIPVPTESLKAPRRKKRTSDQISEDGYGERESTARPEPPAKRRNTRSRDSVARDVEDPLFQEKVELQDAEATPAKPQIKSRKRASSASRKKSTVSTAVLQAKLQGVPDDAAIDAALEEDLNRPFSDDEQIAIVEQAKPKRAKSKKAAAPAGAVRAKQSEAEGEPRNDTPINATERQDSQLDMYETDVDSKPKGRKPRASKKVAANKADISKRASTESTTATKTHADVVADGSVLTSRTVEDDSGHETDASATSKSVARKESKRKAASKSRGKKTGAGAASKNVESIVESQPESEVANALSTALKADQQDIDKKIAELTKEIEEEEAGSKKPGRSTKGAKGKAVKGKGKKDKMPQLSMPGAFSPIVLESADPSFASALSSTSPPMKSNLQHGVLAQPIGDEMELDMEIRSPEQQSTPTPKRVAPPSIPPRSSARPTPTPLADRSAIPRPTPTPTPTRSVRKSLPREGALAPQEMSPSAQSSDVENAPPSSRPESTRPPLAPMSPINRVVLAAPATPTTSRRVGMGLMSPSKIGGGLKSQVPWSSVDVEMVFQQRTTPDAEQENWFATKDELTSPEKGMSVEQWIYENARRAEDELRREGERVVGLFESEGRRAMVVLEGIACE